MKAWHILTGAVIATAYPTGATLRAQSTITIEGGIRDTTTYPVGSDLSALQARLISNQNADVEVRLIVKRASWTNGLRSQRTDFEPLFDERSAKTNSNGVATFERWPAPTTVGEDSVLVEATVNDTLIRDSFVITFEAGGADRFVVVEGTNLQQATINSAVPTKPSVRVMDKHGNGVPNHNVNLRVVSGGGKIEPTDSARTDSGGFLRFQWIVGSEPGVNIVSASIQLEDGEPQFRELTAWATRQCMDRPPVHLCGRLLISVIRTISGVPVPDEFFDLSVLFPFGNTGPINWFTFGNFDIPLASVNPDKSTEDTTQAGEPSPESLAFAFANLMAGAGLGILGDQRLLFGGVGISAFAGREYYTVGGGSFELSGSMLHGSYLRFMVAFPRQKFPPPGDVSSYFLMDFMLWSPRIDAPVLHNIAIRGSLLIPFFTSKGSSFSRIVLSIPFGDVLDLMR